MLNESFPNKKSKQSYNVPSQNASRPVIVGGRYELLELIGHGSMARVYRAQDTVLERPVAVKLLREEYGNDRNFVARFYREARALATLSSPYIADVYDYGKHDGTYYIAMQYIAGPDLKEVLQQEGRLAPGLAIAIINQVLIALSAAHAHGIIHRDVKPHNILLRASDGIVKLTDFGVAHARNEAEITTSTGETIGTANYMSPEQASGGPIGPATDLYATGVVLYEMLAGRLPFQGNHPMQIMYMHLNDPPPTLSSIGVTVPPELERIVMRTLEKDPAKRYQSANQMRAALGQLSLPVPPVEPIINRAWQSKQVGFLPVQPLDLPYVNPRIRGGVTTTAEPSRPKFLLPLIGLLALLVIGLAAMTLFLNTHSDNRPNVTSTQLAVVPPPTASVPASTNSPAPATTTSEPSATDAAPVATQIPAVSYLPTQTSAPDSAAVLPTDTVPVLPTATRPTVPTVTPRPTAPPALTVAPTTTSTASAKGNGNANANGSNFSPYWLTGAYKRDDGQLYGEPEVALYGSGSDYSQGTVNFTLDKVPGGEVVLEITGLDDERIEHCQFQIILNATTIFDGANTFPNVPDGDNGEGGSSRYWGRMSIPVPANLLKAGQNTLTFRNNTPWNGYLGIPYILINNLRFVSG